MLKTKISDDERSSLQQFSKTSPVYVIRQKCYAILIADQGLTSEAVADVVGKTKRSIDRWIKGWNANRMASVFSGHTMNSNAAKLTYAQKQQIKQVLQQTPSAQGLPKEFWDVPTLKNYISAQFDVVYDSNESYYFLLRFSGLSFKYPDKFDVRRNEQFIEQRMKEIKTEIAPLLKDDSWEVFSVDEVRMDQEAIVRKAWLKKGEKTILKVNRNKQSQSYFGLLSQKDYKCHLYEIQGMQNSETVLKVLKQFLSDNPDKKIAIVWDNAAFHRSKMIKEALGSGNLLERVHLIWMPPYAPDHNPIEKVWGATKQKVSNIQRDSFQETKQAFADYISSRTFRYSF